MTRRHPNHVLEDRSRSRLRSRFEDVGFAVDDLHKDYGEDMLVRIFRDGRATPHSFYVQLKSTSAIPVGTFCSVRVTTNHVRNWLSFPQPVFLIVWIEKQDLFVWESAAHLVDATRLDAKSKTITLHVPMANVVDPAGIVRMVNITRNRIDMLRKYRECGELLCELLEDNSELRIEEYEPENECVIVRHPNGGGVTSYFFGDMARLCALVEKREGVTLKDIVLKQLDEPTFDIKFEGSSIVYRDRSGSVVHEFSSREEQRFFNRVSRETRNLADVVDEISKLPMPRPKRKAR